jgi:hypothetical protein
MEQQENKRTGENVMHMVVFRDVDKYVNNFVSNVCTSGEYIKYSLLDPSRPRLVIACLFHKNKIFSSEPQDSRQKVDVLILIILYIIYTYTQVFQIIFSFQIFLTKFWKNFTYTLFLILFARRMKSCKT